MDSAVVFKIDDDVIVVDVIVVIVVRSSSYAHIPHYKKCCFIQKVHVVDSDIAKLTTKAS